MKSFEIVCNGKLVASPESTSHLQALIDYHGVTPATKMPNFFSVIDIDGEIKFFRVALAKAVENRTCTSFKMVTPEEMLAEVTEVLNAAAVKLHVAENRYADVYDWDRKINQWMHEIRSESE